MSGSKCNSGKISKINRYLQISSTCETWYKEIKQHIYISRYKATQYISEMFLKCPLSSVQFSHSVMSNSLWHHELQHARPRCLSLAPGVYPNLCPSSRWCHPAISSSVIPFSCPQSLPASVFSNESTLCMRWLSNGVSALASVLPKNTQDWSPLEWTGWISLHSKGLSRVFSNTTVQKHQFFGTQLSSLSNSHIHTWPLEKP